MKMWCAGSSPHTRGAPLKSARNSTRRGDHPRIRGEHCGLVWVDEGDSGIIPSYAGSTSCTSISTCSFWGSSPHTRGARPVRPLPRLQRRDHPRIRGEHLGSVVASLAEPGIIPAYAGSTDGSHATSVHRQGSSPHTRGALPTSRRQMTRQRDHPRIRGEHLVYKLLQGFRAGIIPAYAGSTARRCPTPPRGLGSSPHTRGARCRTPFPIPRCRDHPRIRGEHCAVAILSFDDVGIIPAYAGSTPSCPAPPFRYRGSSPHTRGAQGQALSSHQAGRDHPRIRGEHTGKPDWEAGLWWIIPAYAGSTAPAFSQ